MNLAYPVEIIADGAAFFTATFPDLPEVVGHGASPADALEDVRLSMEDDLGSRLLHRREIPTPSEPNGRTTVAPCALVAAKSLLFMEMRRQNVSQSELARRMGVFRTHIGGIFDLDRATSVPTLDAAFAALGKRLIVGLQ